MITKAVKREIDRTIKDVWLHDICKDYGDGLLLREASVQCSLYYHLRNRLSGVLQENRLYIYPEFYLKELRYRADLAIVEMELDAPASHLSERLADIAAIIELKYVGGNALSTENYIRTDMPKLKSYAQNLGYDCQYYFGVIYETECAWLHWFDGRSTAHWANGRLTELNAGYLNGRMYFEVNSYNHMNRRQGKSSCDVKW